MLAPAKTNEVTGGTVMNNDDDDGEAPSPMKEKKRKASTIIVNDHKEYQPMEEPVKRRKIVEPARARSLSPPTVDTTYGFTTPKRSFDTHRPVFSPSLPVTNIRDQSPVVVLDLKTHFIVFLWCSQDWEITVSCPTRSHVVFECSLPEFPIAQVMNLIKDDFAITATDQTLQSLTKRLFLDDIIGQQKMICWEVRFDRDVITNRAQILSVEGEGFRLFSFLVLES